MTRSLVSCALLLVAAVVCQAQESEKTDLLSKVPAIEFLPWRESGESNSAKEFIASFPSARSSKYPINDTVPIRIFLPKEANEPSPVVLILHYWGARDLKFERAFSDQLASRGVASVIMTLPYHLGRTPNGFRSGELAIQPDPEKLKATMIQAAFDVKRTVDFIESHPEFDSKRIGIAGTSLGALVSALAYGVEPRFTRAAFVLGGVDLAQILWQSSLLPEAREALRRRGFTEDRLRPELAEVEPLTYLGSRRDDPVFIIGGKYDTVVPASSTKALIDAFSAPKSLWLDTGHYGGIFVQSRVVKEVSNYFQTEFEGKSYVAPKRLYAPTLRVGVQATTSSGFDIGVGIDLWRSNQRGDITATGLLTPRGPQLFIGARISTGLSFGVSAGARRVGIGIFWSRVL